MMRDIRGKFAVCLLASATGMTALASNEQHLISHYEFESLAGGKTPSASGGSKLSVPRGGELKGLFDSVAGQCLYFENMTQPTCINLSNNAAQSLFFWIKTPYSDQNAVFCQSQNGEWVLRNGAEKGILLEFRDGTKQKQLNVDYFMTKDKWSQIGLVFSGGKLSLYINSKLRETLKLSSFQFSPTLKLGSCGAKEIYFDEIRLYDRPLPADEVDELYQSERYAIAVPQYSRFVLQSYMSRALFTQGIYARPYQEDIFRMIDNIRPRIMMAAVGMWGYEDRLDETYLNNVRRFCERINEIDPRILVGGAVFMEKVSRTVVSEITIPDYVYEAFELPIPETPRPFSFTDMVKTDNPHRDLADPNFSKLEANMWLFYAACEQIDAGVDMVHIGILTISSSRGDYYGEVARTVRLIRERGAPRSRLGKVLITHGGSMDRNGNIGASHDGNLICDFMWFAVTPKEIPDKKWNCELVPGFSHAAYGRTVRGIHPSGWETRLPIVSHLDTSPVNPKHEIGVCYHDSWDPWGLQEIRWFSNALNKEERNAWLRYMTYRIPEIDPVATAMLPAALVRPGEETSYYANTPSQANGFEGFDQEETIKTLFNEVEFGYNREPVLVPEIDPNKEYPVRTANPDPVVALYAETFENSPDGDDLHGQNPNGNLPGTWMSKGSIDTTGNHAVLSDTDESPSIATLPFSPEPGRIYTLSAAINNNSTNPDDSVWVGFGNTDENTFFSTSGAVVRICRSAQNNYYNVDTESGTLPGLATGAGTLRMVLDTTSNIWTLATYWNYFDRVSFDSFVSPPDISQVGFGFSDGSGTDSLAVSGATVDNFILSTTTPVPSLTLYGETFNGSPINADLGGRNPDGLLPGAWSSSESINTTGTNAVFTGIGKKLPSYATLEFSPEPGNIYTLTADLNNDSTNPGDSVLLGFRNADADTVFSASGTAARICRSASGGYDVVTETLASGRLNGLATGLGTMKLVLNTTEARWTLAVYWNGILLGKDTFQSIPDIRYAGFGFLDDAETGTPNRSGSTVDNFRLTVENEAQFASAIVVTEAPITPSEER
ncbi:LamG domain-containing protein [Pontiella sulfatireligans]|uniref:LamG-like jellyroll fold domain-containing protein n=1 Tax=Pontiella sulfatireligans TaxID=2750658 RepID=A0A6C2UJU4_9BACT|nr:LamG domain-containing protein [Pontiella sulfatireligans]VGO19584.1 hypothetical protein SCARR_01643 [Pontiella sulfatireligans]